MFPCKMCRGRVNVFFNLRKMYDVECISTLVHGELVVKITLFNQRGVAGTNSYVYKIARSRHFLWKQLLGSPALQFGCQFLTFQRIDLHCDPDRTESLNR